VITIMVDDHNIPTPAQDATNSAPASVPPQTPIPNTPLQTDDSHTTPVVMHMPKPGDPGVPTMMVPPVASGMPQAPESKVSQAQAMGNVLQGIKLPERMTFRASGDKQAPPAPEPVIYSTDSPPIGVVTHMPRSEKEIPPDSMSTVHTFGADLKDVVRDQKVSLIHAAAMESEKKYAQEKEQTTIPAPRRSNRTFAIIFAILLFLVLGAAALFGVAYVSQQHTAQTQLPQDTSLIFSEQHVVLSLNDTAPADVRQTIAQMRLSASAPLGSIIRIVPTIRETAADGTSADRLATTQEFLKALGVSLSDETLRSFDSTFFFGIHAVDRNALVLVIPVVSYDRAFAGMLAWEPHMNRDLAPAFTAVPSTVMASDGSVTQRVFQDTVMRNYDVRIFKDDNGVVQLYYSFPTPSMLIIAESAYSFTELLSRLQSGRKL
jgi:hypothetical protein